MAGVPPQAPVPSSLPLFVLPRLAPSGTQHLTLDLMVEQMLFLNFYLSG